MDFTQLIAELGQNRQMPEIPFTPSPVYYPGTNGTALVKGAPAINSVDNPGVMAQGQPTFQQAASQGVTNPRLTKGGKLLTMLASGIEGALAGRAAEEQMIAQSGGRRSGGFGIGFEGGLQQGQALQQLPWIRAMRAAQLEQLQAENKRITNQSELVSVTDANGNTYQIPRSNLGGYISTGMRVEGANQRADARDRNQRNIADQRTDAAMLLHGMKRDPSTGQYVPMTEDELPPAMRSTILHQRSLDEYNQARAAYNQARAEGEPERVKQAQQRLELAERNYRIRDAEFSRDTFGTVNGKPVPGGATDAQGNPIGSRSPQVRSQLQAQKDEAISKRQAHHLTQNPPTGYARIQSSDGRVIDIPGVNLETAKQRDPNLKVIVPAR